MNNYFKLLLLERDFRKFGENLAEKKWQKEVTIKIASELNKIARRFFKYSIPISLGRKLLVVEEASSGKFIEFIIFYLLREFIINKIDLMGAIKKTSNQGFKEFLSIIASINDISQIKWSYQIKNTDIDIFISNKYGLFLKTGILNSGDIQKIVNEIRVSERIGLEKVFQVIDIAKNLGLTKKLITKKLIQSHKVILIDVGEFLDELLKIAYANKNIALELSKSSILSWAGFHSGG